MTQAICLATYPLSALDPRGEVACALALRQLELDSYYGPQECSLFLCAPPAEVIDLSEFQSREENNFLKARKTYAPEVLKALTHPALAALSKVGLQGEIRYWSEQIDLAPQVEESLGECENALIFALNLFERKLAVYEFAERHQEREQKCSQEFWLKNQVP